METGAFIRQYHIRAPNIMWFLGAGASAAANIPTASDMIWDFKRRLYCSSQRKPLSTCQDLGDPVLRLRLQQFFDSLGSYPPAGSDEEYAAYFEAMHPAEADRRRYIDHKVAQATPSHGHLALATLLRLDRARVVWTTNFDRVIEDATAAAMGGTGHLRVATLDTASAATEAMNEGYWPFLIKLHGDFHSRRLKNTQEELREQEGLLERALVDACSRQGLAVIGYSGRDNSVMSAFEAVLSSPNPFPNGLYWFSRSDSTPSPRVNRLVEKARAAGVEAHQIPVETFDELMGDLLLFVEDIPPDLRERLERTAARISDVPLPPPGVGHPTIRFNALAITSYPNVCRRFRCKVGGTREVRKVASDAGADLVLGRRRLGVLAFGSDAEVRRVFGRRDLTDMDLHSIGTRDLVYEESAEKGLLLEALVRAVARERPVLAERRGRRFMLLPDPSRADEPGLAALSSAAEQLCGAIAKGGPRWSEAVSLRLDRRAGRLWLLLLQTIWTEPTDDLGQQEAAKAFRQRRLAARRNKGVNDVTDAWVQIIAGAEAEIAVAAFGMGEDAGVDAKFTLSRMTAFSRRGSSAANSAKGGAYG